jgi:hypothetical protein
MRKLLISILYAVTLIAQQVTFAADDVHYLFNSSGNWIAFRVGEFVYDSEGEWVGWLAWKDADVATVDGEYLGTIVDGNRLIRFRNRPYKGYPGYPGYAGYSPLPSGASDVVIPKKK